MLALDSLLKLPGSTRYNSVPRHPEHRPQRPRYPYPFKEDKVTIGLGVLTADSVILAADTQISWENYFLKTGEGKVSWYPNQNN
jgi:hypothetical protein